MIKVIISSKELARTLNIIDLENNVIVSISATKDYIQFNCVNNIHRIYLANTIKLQDTIPQVFTRWDWISDLLNQADEQPIVLTITEKKIQVLFEYQ